jgi:tRNA threonylcarbamoyladenosine biosynthesis protein TsaB
MALILSLETSTDVCSVALHKNAVLVKELSVNEPQAHAAQLSPLIQQIFVSASVLPHQVEAVAITAGPGSYTGLRIGASTAKGMCYALGIPLISVTTLDLLAFQASVSNVEHALLCPMIDARRTEVYCQVFGPDLSVMNKVEARVIDENSFAELLEKNKMLFFGNGAGKCKGVIRSRHAYFLDRIFPSASFLGRLAHEKFRRNEFEDLMTFKPFYLKDFVAKKAQPLLD